MPRPRPWWQDCGPIELGEAEIRRRLSPQGWNTNPLLANLEGFDFQVVKPLPGGLRYHCRLERNGETRTRPFCELEPDPLARPLAHILGEGRRPGGCQVLLRDLTRPPKRDEEPSQGGGTALALILLIAGIALLSSV